MLQKITNIPEMDRNKISPEIFDILRGWQQDQSEFKILVYLVSKNFNIIRIPTYYDRAISSLKAEDVDLFFDTLDDLSKDLSNAYNYTQNRLGNIGYKEDDKIIISRRICKYDDYHDLDLSQYRDEEKISGIHPLVLASYILYVKNSRSNRLKLEVDTLSSWSLANDDTSLPSVYGVIDLVQEVSIKDILFFNISDGNSNPLESNEILFINRSNTGLIEFDISNINFSEKFYNNQLPDRLIKTFDKNTTIIEGQSYFRKRSVSNHLPDLPLNRIEVPKIKCSQRILRLLRNI